MEKTANGSKGNFFGADTFTDPTFDGTNLERKEVQKEDSKKEFFGVDTFSSSEFRSAPEKINETDINQELPANIDTVLPVESTEDIKDRLEKNSKGYLSPRKRGVLGSGQSPQETGPATQINVQKEWNEYLEEKSKFKDYRYANPLRQLWDKWAGVYNFKLRASEEARVRLEQKKEYLKSFSKE